jgi:hypothetical protein
MFDTESLYKILLGISSSQTTFLAARIAGAQVNGAFNAGMHSAPPGSFKDIPLDKVSDLRSQGRLEYAPSVNPCARESLLNVLEDVPEPSRPCQVQAIACPVLFTTSDYDPFFSKGVLQVRIF